LKKWKIENRKFKKSNFGKLRKWILGFLKKSKSEK